MIQPSNTPPDGDFAAYVERLTRPPAGPAPREDMIGSRVDSPLGTPFAADGASHVPPHRPWTANAILTHVKWVALAWIAFHLLAKVIPGAGFLFIPAIAGYAAWVFLRRDRDRDRDSPIAVARRLRELAARALADAKNAGRARGK